MESWKMRMEAGQDKRRMLWRNQELWLLGGGAGTAGLHSCAAYLDQCPCACRMAWDFCHFCMEDLPPPSGGAGAAGAYPETDAGAYEKKRSRPSGSVPQSVRSFWKKNTMKKMNWLSVKKELNLEFEKQMWNQERISAESKEKQVILNNLEESLQELQGRE